MQLNFFSSLIKDNNKIFAGCRWNRTSIFRKHEQAYYGEHDLQYTFVSIGVPEKLFTDRHSNNTAGSHGGKSFKSQHDPATSDNWSDSLEHCHKGMIIIDLNINYELWIFI